MSDAKISMSLPQAVELFALLVDVRKEGRGNNPITDDNLFQVTESLRDAMVGGNDQVVECGSCGGYHHELYFGDCRNDRYRY